MADGAAFIAIGDVLLTSDTTREISVPFIAENEPLRGPDGHIAGLSQKAVLIGSKTMVLWAGRLDLAVRALRRIEAVSDGGDTLIDFPALIEDLGWLDPPTDEVSLIYHFANDGPIETRWFNASWDARRKIAAAGSGARHFLEELLVGSSDVLGGGEQETPPSLTDFLGRTAIAILKQMSGRETLDRHYGGWFELIACDGHSFVKTPICCKAWLEEDGELLTDMPLLFSAYHDAELQVFEVRRRRGGGTRVKLHRVGSPLDAAQVGPPDIRAANTDWAVEIHFTLRKGGNGAGMFIRPVPLAGRKMGVTFDRGLAQVDLPADLIEQVKSVIELRETRPGLRERDSAETDASGAEAAVVRQP